MKYLKLIRWTDKKGREQTFSLMDKISWKWQDLGIMIGLESTQLDVYDFENQGNPTECCERVLTEWLYGQDGTRGDYPVTWNGLRELLQDVEISEVAERFMEALQKSGTAMHIILGHVQWFFWCGFHGLVTHTFYSFWLYISIEAMPSKSLASQSAETVTVYIE